MSYVFGCLGIAGLIFLSVGLLLALRDERRLRAEREREWAQERQSLLTRIQAPEVGVFDALVEADEPDAAHVHFDDDEDEG